MHNGLRTKWCISIAGRPGLFGMTVHNAGYRALKLDYLYQAFKVNDAREAMTAVRALGIRGCSVSMPFKEQVLPYVDDMDPAARAIAAVNTVVNDGGRLTGCNTDASGAVEAIQRMKLPTDTPVLVLGAGGVARAILYALGVLGFKSLSLSCRNRRKAEPLVKIMPFGFVDWNKRDSIEAGFIINATPVGMAPDQRRMPVASATIAGSRAVFDVVMNPMESLLVRRARSLGKKVSPGYKLGLYQAMAQFKLYTGQEAPLSVMEAAAKRLLKHA